jgi:hypothetical protein
MSAKAKSLNVTKTTDFENDLPELERVFTEVLVDLEITLNNFLTKEIASEATRLVQYLCHPDPRKRGFKTNIELQLQQYGFERFISRLNHFAREAELRII